MTRSENEYPPLKNFHGPHFIEIPHGISEVTADGEQVHFFHGAVFMISVRDAKLLNKALSDMDVDSVLGQDMLECMQIVKYYRDEFV
jgi:hypothetical protein